MLAWPLETLSVRGLPIRRVTKITLLDTGEQLDFAAPFGVAAMKDADPRGEIRITVPTNPPSSLVPVIAIDVEPLAGLD